MTDKRGAYLALATLLSLAVWSLPVRADQVLLQTTPLVEGSLASVSPFAVSGPGTVTVMLTDIGWPDKLASLTFAATTPTAVLASMTGTGQISFKVTSAGIYDAVVGAVASPGFLDLGWYSLGVLFAPAAVPLPSSGFLLLAGLGALTLLWRRMRPAPLSPAAAGLPSARVA